MGAACTLKLVKILVRPFQLFMILDKLLLNKHKVIDNYVGDNFSQIWLMIRWAKYNIFSLTVVYKCFFVKSVLATMHPPRLQPLDHYPSLRKATRSNPRWHFQMHGKWCHVGASWLGQFSRKKHLYTTLILLKWICYFFYWNICTSENFI